MDWFKDTWESIKTVGLPAAIDSVFGSKSQPAEQPRVERIADQGSIGSTTSATVSNNYLLYGGAAVAAVLMLYLVLKK